jgi:hypothetical protein
MQAALEHCTRRPYHGAEAWRAGTHQGLVWYNFPVLILIDCQGLLLVDRYPQ